MELNELAHKCGEWLRGSGPESDIVISSRIRLARNLAEFPFIRKCNHADRVAIERTLRDTVGALSDSVSYVDVNSLDDVDRSANPVPSLFERLAFEPVSATTSPPLAWSKSTTN